MSVRELNGVLQLLGVKPPHLEAVIHPGRDNSRACRVEVRAEHLVPVTLDPSEDGDVVLSLDVPQPQRVVLGHRQQQVRIQWVELDLIDRVSVAHKVSDAGHGGGAQQPHDA